MKICYGNLERKGDNMIRFRLISLVVSVVKLVKAVSIKEEYQKNDYSEFFISYFIPTLVFLIQESERGYLSYDKKQQDKENKESNIYIIINFITSGFSDAFKSKHFNDNLAINYIKLGLTRNITYVTKHIETDLERTKVNWNYSYLLYPEIT